MKQWYMLTLVGEDQPGIVAEVSRALYTGGCHLGEASMIRLGGNFTVMLMVQFEGNATALKDLLAGVTEKLKLHCHVDPIEGHLHDHRIPDVQVTVLGADRAGIVADVTAVLTGAGLEILDLDTDVGGTAEQPFYVMQLEGLATQGIEALQQAIDKSHVSNVDVNIQPIDTLVG